MKPLKWIPRGLLLILFLAIGSGCATQYGCQGMPDQAHCLSTTEAYAVTHKALAETAQDEHIRDDSHALELQPRQQPVPKIDDPTPIRTPSHVMRIWIAPWEDAEGDLMVSNYVYTELEPRRWLIGKAAPTLSPSLLPLQIEQRLPEKPSARDPLDTEARTFPLGKDNADQH